MRIVIESDDGSLAIDQRPASAWQGPLRYAPRAARDGGAAARPEVGRARLQVAGAGAVNGGRAPSRRFLERTGQPFRAAETVNAGAPPARLVKRVETKTPPPEDRSKSGPGRKRK